MKHNVFICHPNPKKVRGGGGGEIWRTRPNHPPPTQNQENLPLGKNKILN